MSDLYGMLGVARTASTDELKLAWRRLARAHHPDLNPGDADAAERLAAINAAYAVLSDPERRAAYDRYGPDAASAFFDPELVTPEPPPSTPPRPRPVEAGEDWEASVVLDARVAREGGGVPVTVREPETCAVCGGTGWRRAGRACGRCEGGVIPGIGPVMVAVPAGLVSGQVLVARGQGAPGRGKGAPRGDLVVTVHVPPSFRLVGDEVVTEVPCPATLLHQGGTIRAPLPDGKAVTLRIRPQTRVGQRLRLRGKALHGRDLLVQLVELPERPVEVVVASIRTG